MLASHIVLSHSLKIPYAELQFKTSRSGGPGGQNVNKLETRVEVLFDLANSPSLPNHIHQRLLNSLTSQLDSSGILHIVVQDTRSQWKNKQLAIERLTDLLKSALIVRKKRIATKPTHTAREVRLRTKKARSKTKQLRKVVVE
ncbi:MAG: alternative ribosome rescue aminoacyl-tRNA hydrolase ArfB [Ignavibacteriales bacterium]|nr:alternative ribosome rescue aminoacyl-tRNA hydrolase ArfB [Ignavibacteriales bacterium]